MDKSHIPPTATLIAALTGAGDALARADARVAGMFAPIADHLVAAHGFGLVTITRRDVRDGSYLRLYSSMPDAYEASGRKPPTGGDWSRLVIDERRTFVARSYEEMALAIEDHEKIRDLGLESIVNVPIVVSGEVLGTLNCLAGPGRLTEEMVAACEAMRALAALALMLAADPPG